MKRALLDLPQIAVGVCCGDRTARPEPTPCGIPRQRPLRGSLIPAHVMRPLSRGQQSNVGAFALAVLPLWLPHIELDLGAGHDVVDAGPCEGLVMAIEVARSVGERSSIRANKCAAVGQNAGNRTNHSFGSIN
jgi:phage baseplate assembly protein W